MKTKIPLLFALILLMCISTSYRSDERTSDRKYVPIFMKRPDLEVSVKYIPGARELNNPGKIYYKAPYIYVNERYKGVHIINNTNPERPVSEGFVTAPGCIDMAVKDDMLYMDNSVDLVAFDLNTKRVTERIREIFPEPAPPSDQYYHSGYDRPENMVLVGWEKRAYK